MHDRERRAPSIGQDGKEARRGAGVRLDDAVSGGGVNMWLKTNKRLREENKRLYRELNTAEKQIEYHKRRSALMDAAQLPECEGLACLDCRYAVYQIAWPRREYHLIGCGKGRTCKDYEPSARPNQEEQARLLQEQQER